MSTPAELSPERIKSCCADLYAGDWARLLVGETLHPGGIRLTDRLAELLRVTRSDRVLDLAAGRGATAVHLAATVGCEVVGLELSPASVEAAREHAVAAGVADHCTFRVGDAERVRIAGGGFDVVICECAFCTFPDKRAAAAEMARLLRPGGRVGISDLTRNGRLRPELASLLGWVACIADALPVEEYARRLQDADLRVERIEGHDQVLRDLVESIRDRLGAARLLSALGKVALPGAGLDEAQALARTALEEVRGGRLGYAIVTAVRPDHR